MGEPALLACAHLSAGQLEALVVRGEGGLEGAEGRLLELQGRDVTGMTAAAWPGARAALAAPVQAVFLRRGGGGGGLRQDIAAIQVRKPLNIFVLD